MGPSLAELPGEFSWLCTVCAPLYELKTVVGGSKGQERPRLNRRGPSIAQPGQQSTQQAEGFGEGGGGQGLPAGPPVAAETVAVGQIVTPPPPPLPTSNSTTAGPGVSGQVCVLFLTGEFLYGLSGKTVGV